jgi:hypothetical protein
MFEPSGHLGLKQESGLGIGVVGAAGLQFLESDVATELAVKRQEHLAQSASGVRPYHLESATSIADAGEIVSAAGVPGVVTGRRKRTCPIGIDRRIWMVGGREARGSSGRKHAAMELDVSCDLLFQLRDILRVQHTIASQDFSQRLLGGTTPDLERAYELIAVDGTALEGAQTEAQVA